MDEGGKNVKRSGDKESDLADIKATTPQQDTTGS